MHQNKWQKFTMPENNKAATQYHLNQDLKFLYIKNQNLNEQIYRIHLECTSSWQNSWRIIQASIDNKL